VIFKLFIFTNYLVRALLANLAARHYTQKKTTKTLLAAIKLETCECFSVPKRNCCTVKFPGKLFAKLGKREGGDNWPIKNDSSK